MVAIAKLKSKILRRMYLQYLQKAFCSVNTRYLRMWYNRAADAVGGKCTGLWGVSANNCAVLEKQACACGTEASMP